MGLDGRNASFPSRCTGLPGPVWKHLAHLDVNRLFDRFQRVHLPGAQHSQIVVVHLHATIVTTLPCVVVLVVLVVVVVFVVLVVSD